MLRATITYTVDPGHLDTLKVGASRYLPDIQPGLRTEILARALGFNSWAAVRASGETRRTLSIPAALTFAKERGLEIQPVDLHHAMAQATLLRIAEKTPLLHSDGYGNGYIRPRPDAIAEGLTPGTPAFYDRCRELIDAEFSKSRGRLFSGKTGSGALRAMALFAGLSKTKKVGPNAPSSYRLKHICEHAVFDLGDGVVLHGAYVSNSEAIVAAMDYDFPVECDNADINVSVGIALTSLRKAEAFYYA